MRRSLAILILVGLSVLVPSQSAQALPLMGSKDAGPGRATATRLRPKAPELDVSQQVESRVSLDRAVLSTPKPGSGVGAPSTTSRY